MEGFTYTDIFDTKGIEYLIVIGFLVLIVPFWLFLNRPLKTSRMLSKSFETLRLNILKIQAGLLYSGNHTWSHLESSGSARIGIDDLLVHLTGPVKVNILRNPGERIRKGEPVVELEQEGKKLRITSPISGEIQNINGSLVKNPENLNYDPYGTGWLYKLKPENWVQETGSCHLADKAVEWTKGEIERFKDFIAMSVKKHQPEAPLLILQEGGELVDHPLSEMPHDIWHDFQVHFLGEGNKK